MSQHTEHVGAAMTETVLVIIEAKAPPKPTQHICCNRCRTIICSGNKAVKTWKLNKEVPEACIVCEDLQAEWFEAHKGECPV